MSINTMHELFLHEIRDLYNAEGQVLKALPGMAEKASNRKLVAALAKHLKETEEHEARLEQCFELLEVPAKGKRCQGMEGLLQEADEQSDDAENDEIRDAAIIAACQKVEHYEISGYGTARAFAEKLGLSEIATLLTDTLDEESAANERLTEIAESEVNVQAMETMETNGEPKEKPATSSAKTAKSAPSRRAGARKPQESGSRRN